MKNPAITGHAPASLYVSIAVGKTQYRTTANISIMVSIARSMHSWSASYDNAGLLSL